MRERENGERLLIVSYLISYILKLDMSQILEVKSQVVV